MHNIADTLAARDVYIDYPFEEVMFRWHRDSKSVFRKFYGKVEETGPVENSNRLYRDALLSGDEVSRDVYVTGKPRAA
jgi:hypothetical protein